MAPIGGGPPTGSWAGASGIGSSVNYIGKSRIDERDYWQGYSGGVVVNNSTAIQFQFKAPSVSTIATYIFQDTESPGSNQYIAYVITIDGQIVMEAHFTNHTAGNAIDLDVPITFAIPAFSDVKIEAKVAESENHTTYGMLMLKEI